MAQDLRTGPLVVAPTAFAADPGTHRYYELRAAEYDDWWRGSGRFAERERPGWDEEVAEVSALLGALPAARTLDVACGTGYLTRCLRGLVVGLDQSPTSVAIAQERMPEGVFIVGDALALPVADGAFQRIVTAHFYGHLPAAERDAFLGEARRVAAELVVVDSALRADVPPERTETRILNDGSVHRVFKRFLTGEGLAAEIGGRPLLSRTWFVAAAAGLR